MSSLSQRSATPTAGIAQPRQVLLIVCAGVVMASLDLFIVNVALPQIATELGQPNLADLSWVLNGYAIVYASLLVLAGRLADQHSRKSGFLLGVAIFTAASAACGAATSVPLLVAFRSLCIPAGAGRAPRGPAFAQVRLPAGRGDLHRGLGGLRCRDQRADAGGVRIGW